jgi:hypothetical protein
MLQLLYWIFVGMIVAASSGVKFWVLGVCGLAFQMWFFAVLLCECVISE